MRDPDPSGWAWWESRVPGMGREQLRQAFDESIEFGQVVATLTASGPPSGAASSLATARVDLFNQPGDQMRARDGEWGISLLSLPGRAGLDLGLGLSYSSLVWTRSGPYAYFDEDRGSPSPGFQLGFATISGPYFDAQVARNVYVLVTLSGRRVALRQVGTSNTYEAADSSYLQLTAISRWDVTQIGNDTLVHTSRTIYAAAGSVVSTADPLGHGNTFGYADSFSDGNNSRGTFAYPTTLTDADGFASSLQYNFDFGARTRVEGPPPKDQPAGLVQTFAYDGAARVERVTTVNNNAYTRYVYGPNYVQQFTTVNAVADEGYTNTVFDGVGRQQKVYSDALGRQWKTEVMNWGGGSVYSTTASTLNALDQATFVREYDGTDQSGVYQETATVYDGYGRVPSRHRPEQGGGKNTVYTYYDDDTVETVTDARRAVATYHYNGHHLVEDVLYDGASAGVQTVSVNYDYDAAGNRVLMEDGGGGSTAYAYDTLSQLKTETRRFSGLGGTFPVNYEYNLKGQPKKISDPFGASVNYDYDQAGRVQAVTNTGFANARNVSSYATGMQYRAWGGLKQFTFGAASSHSLAVTYDDRMRVHTYRVNFSNPYSTYSKGVDIDYYDDNRLKYTRQLGDANQDRAFFYEDPAGHLTKELTGDEARGVPITSVTQRQLIPFQQTFEYDVWDNVKRSSGWHWSKSLPTVMSHYENNRNDTFTYDAEVNVTQEDTRHYTYDAAGRVLSVTEPSRRTNRPGMTTNYTYDGDGQQIRNEVNGSVTYRLVSTLLRGQQLTDINAQGQKVTGYVYANDTLLATQQQQGATQAESSVNWVHRSPDGSGEWQTPNVAWGETLWRMFQLDMMGRDVRHRREPHVVRPDLQGGEPEHAQLHLHDHQQAHQAARAVHLRRADLHG